jgi:hypothetical protein
MDTVHGRTVADMAGVLTIGGLLAEAQPVARATTPLMAKAAFTI